MPWQKTFSLAKRSKGCHLITEEVTHHLSEGLRGTKIGILYLFIQHTSAALTVNENYDPDMTMCLDKIVPESMPWLHTDEGPDVSHTKTALIGTSLQLPITDGRLNLGTWQGIYLAEFRHMPHSRKIVATIL
ncbi:hypothetical protein JB92DRAFT_3084708 [Gautieria morchelliformis]|nr:hypothetical protein JB92DRAFT_3084708 [Gautieria morchelliformis]